jgi:Tfp pilus assembly protein PilV
MRQRKWQVASGTWRATEPSTPHAARRTPHASGMTLIEVLMSMMVTGIGVLGVIALLPLAFVRAVQATNLTNGTILRYDAESFIDMSPRLLLRWQAQQTYQIGDIVLVPNPPLNAFYFQCTAITPPSPPGPPGISGSAAPAWVGVAGSTTTDNNLTWTTFANPPARFVVDPLGWYAMSPFGLQGNLGNNGTGGAYQNALPRYNGEIPNAVSAVMQAYLPDSWVEQARAPVTAYTANTATLSNVDLSNVVPSTLTTLLAATSPYTLSRVVLIDATGKISQTRLLTNIATPTVTWSASDPLTGTFVPVMARVETQDVRYTWLLTVMPSSGGGSSNVEVTVFFNRPLATLDEQAYTASGADGVQTPFTVTYTGTKPFVKKGSFLFDCVFGRWYRVVNVADVNATQFNVFVDQPRPSADLLAAQQLNIGLNFGAVFMRGVVDVFPLPLK